MDVAEVLLLRLVAGLLITSSQRPTKSMPSHWLESTVWRALRLSESFRLRDALEGAVARALGASEVSRWSTRFP